MRIKQLKYRQAELELRQLALTLPPGTKLPSERSLAAEYSCNFLTIRKALKYLVDEGLIVRKIGSGTFVERPQRSPGVSRTGEEMTSIGILAFHKSDHYAFSVLQSLAHVALTEKVEIRSAWTHHFLDDGLRQADRLAKEGCKALILPWFPFHVQDELRSFVSRSPLPVCLPILIPGLEKWCFEEADVFGTVMLSATEGIARYFRHLGHRRIAFLGPNSPGNPVFQQKLGAFSCFMSNEDLPNICGLVRPGSPAMDQLAQRWKTFKGELAIVSYDDEYALRFITAMHKLGLNAPRDFVIVGYNNSDASHYSDPPLSTVRQDFHYIGVSLLKHALALGKGESCQSAHGQVLELLVRASCGGAGRIDGALEESMKRCKLLLRVEEGAPFLESSAPPVETEEAGLAVG